MSIIITSIEALDIRFPTSKELAGSDAMNPDPDYSATYIIMRTNHPDGLEGHGLTFTIGRGNEICVRAVQTISNLVVGLELERIFTNMSWFWKNITGDSQLRWLGPEKGVVHLATGAIVNAVWDLYSKVKKKPLWQLIVDMEPEELVSCIDFSYIEDAITPFEALEIIKSNQATKGKRIEELKKSGYPAYTTSAGWLGYSDEKIKRLCQEAIKDGFKFIKMKVGKNIEDDIRRAAIIRKEIGGETKLMMDANQVWGVGEAKKNISRLSRFDPWWIEEPTNPDDILGHAEISKEVSPIKVATGEHCHNRIMFKQFMQSNGMQICQVDSCRVGGLNEILAIMLMAAKFDIPVCPHAGGVGLCEYVQHLSIIDFVVLSGTKEGRVLEYVDHLHEHFVYPVQIENGNYLVPNSEGFSIQMKNESLQEYKFPEGHYWKSVMSENNYEQEKV